MVVQGSAAYRPHCEVLDIMPCGRDPFTGEQLGSCCFPLAASQFPTESVFNFCHNCGQRDACLGRDCTDPAFEPTPGSEAFIEMARVAGWLTTEASDATWHADKTCAELRAERGGDDGPCGISPACCKEDHAILSQRPAPTNCEDTEWGCVHAATHICDRGYWVAADQSGATTGGQGCRVKMHPTLLGVRGPVAGVRLDPNTQLPAPFLDCYQTWPHATSTMCECSFQTEPFIAQRWAELGFTRCLMLPQDDRTWEQACEAGPPDDEFDCRTLGMPMVIDEDGFAAFDAGNRRVDSAVEGCTRVFADLYIDSGGIAHAIACTKFDDEGNTTDFALADLFQDRCAAVYGDYRWDQEFAC